MDNNGRFQLSRKRKYKNFEGDDEDGDVVEAADILLSMKDHVLTEEDAKVLHKIVGKRSAIVVETTNLPRIPPMESIQGIIGRCSEPFERHLTQADLRDDLNRLALNRDKVISFILPLLREHEDVYDSKGIEVSTYGPDGVAYDMIFKSWADSKVYVLNSGWKKFYKTYGLHEHKDYWATVWMFRHKLTDKPCFALTWKHDPTRSPLPRSKSQGKNNNRKS